MNVFPPIKIPDHEVQAWLQSRWREFWQPNWIGGPSGPDELGGPGGGPRGTVAQKLVAAAERAIREGRIDRSTKIRTGYIRYLVNNEPIHQDGTPFFAPRSLSNGLYIETHTSNRQADQQVELLDRYNRR